MSRIIQRVRVSKSTRFDHIRKVLGGNRLIAKRIRSRTDLINLSRKGLVVDCAFAVQKQANIPWPVFENMIGCSARNLQRKRTMRSVVKRRLNPAISERTIELAELISRGQQIFGDDKLFQAWLNAPNVALNGDKPIALADTTMGIQWVMDVLGRAEHGVYS